MPKAMAGQTTILVPIRYPLTDHSSQTLAAAGRLAQNHAPATIRVLHVNLMQNNGSIQTAELTRAISSVLDGVEASVFTRRGFLVEKVILEEANQLGADIVVVGSDPRSRGRRFIRRLLGNDPAIASFLHQNLSDEVEVVEVDADAKSQPSPTKVAGSL
jgi:nucleotide-binding universal stress UspA family protein